MTVLKEKDGGLRMDYENELDEHILDVIQENNQINPFRIKKILNKRLSRKIGWITIKRHLDHLLERHKIKISYETDEGKKKDRLYALTKRY